MDDYLVNINGELFLGPEAKISVFDRGFLYGDSIYEATRTFNKKAFRLNLHLDRLFFSAEKIDMPLTYTRKELIAEVEKTISASAHKDASIRIVVTRGTNSEISLNPKFAEKNNLVIFLKPIKPNPSSWLSEGVSMIFHHKSQSLSGAFAKTGNYQENMLAHKAAVEKEAYDAFMVNSDGHITEATTSNAWIIKDNILYTPPLDDGLLGGITRLALIEMSQAQLLPIPLVLKSLSTDDFIKADECFITSTMRNLVPVTKIEGRPVGDGRPGTLTLRLLSLYLDFAHKD